MLRYILILLFSVARLSAAEPRVWTSTSGSAIEATYLGNFGDNLWLEGVGPQKKLLKMPPKYVSEPDLTLIDTDEVSPLIAAQAIGEDDASILLLEQLFKAKVPQPIENSITLEEALNGLIDRIPRNEDAKISIKFHRKVDEAATRTETITGPTVYACLQSLAEAHELKWSIRKGILYLRPR